MSVSLYVLVLFSLVLFMNQVLFIGSLVVSSLHFCSFELFSCLDLLIQK